jgi:hypothetical protein
MLQWNHRIAALIAVAVALAAAAGECDFWLHIGW